MKIRKWEDFKEFIGKEMYDLWKVMPESFERTVMESGRQVFTHTDTGKKLEVIHDEWGIIKEINRL